MWVKWRWRKDEKLVYLSCFYPLNPYLHFHFPVIVLHFFYQLCRSVFLFIHLVYLLSTPTFLHFLLIVLPLPLIHRQVSLSCFYPLNPYLLLSTFFHFLLIVPPLPFITYHALNPHLPYTSTSLHCTVIGLHVCLSIFTPFFSLSTISSPLLHSSLLPF